MEFELNNTNWKIRFSNKNWLLKKELSELESSDTYDK